MSLWGPIYKISYDLSSDYLKFIVGYTYELTIVTYSVLSCRYEYHQLV